MSDLTWAEILPEDWISGRFVGRLDLGHGPTPIVVELGRAFDATPLAPTVSALLAVLPSQTSGLPELGRLDELDPARLLSPIDLQCVKAAGVTFAVSALERLIEERAGGEKTRAADLRDKIEKALGGGLRSVKPGSREAAALKETLIADGMWSQYLEVAIGPDAEIFTKCPVLATVGTGAAIGVRADSRWNNSEPEVVLVANGRGRAIGATLGNDMNLRDFEGRSALLLGKAKDNNASAALGPLVRLFDESFAMDHVRSADVEMTVTGTDGYVLHGSSTMAAISRPPEELLAQALVDHQYPDGLVLYLGTMFAPTDDRDTPGGGFTHHDGDRIAVFNRHLGTLSNYVVRCSAAPAWSFGIGELMANLAARQLIR